MPLTSPRGVYNAMVRKEYDKIEGWIQTDDYSLTQEIEELIVVLNMEYYHTLLHAQELYTYCLAQSNTPKEFAALAIEADESLSSVLFAMLKDKSHSRILWGVVGHKLKVELDKEFKENL